MPASHPLDSNIPGLRRRREAFPSPRPVASLLCFFAGLAAIAGLLVSESVRKGAPGIQGAAVAAEPSSLVGQFLVATDELTDPRFIRTVVYMIQQDAGGAMGLIVNRPIREAPLSELLDRLGLEGKGVNGQIRLHFGGPVEPGRGFVLHTTDYRIEGTQVIRDGIAITAQPEILQAIGAGTGPRRSLLAFGYAGWDPGQLAAEIRSGAWEVVPADEALVFDDNYEQKWERAMARRTIQL